MVENKHMKTLSNESLQVMKYVYFITNANRTEIKLGVTDNLKGIANTCKMSPDLFQGYVNTHSRLVYFEEYSDLFRARTRFIEVSRWTRAQKEKLIRRVNPDWIDLSIGIIHEEILVGGKLKNPVKRPGLNYN